MNLRDLRRKADVTQIALAQKSGVPRSRIQSAEAGTLTLRTDELQRIKKAVRPALAWAAEMLATEFAEVQSHE